jgi:hypothetical protein
MSIEIHNLESFPPNSNPFLHDAVRMGIQIGKNVTVMMMNHGHERCDKLVIVNTTTGERVMVEFNDVQQET